jgi:hypothetical protein
MSTKCTFNDRSDKGTNLTTNLATKKTLAQKDVQVLDFLVDPSRLELELF